MQLTPTARRVLPYAPLGAAAACAVLGTYVLASWAAGRVLWVKLGAGLAPVQPDAAVCFIFLGVALYAGRSGRPRIAAALAAVVAVFASVVFCEYLLGV